MPGRVPVARRLFDTVDGTPQCGIGSSQCMKRDEGPTISQLDRLRAKRKDKTIQGRFKNMMDGFGWTHNTH